MFDESVTYTSLPNDVKYSLRVSLLDGDTRWRTDRTFPFVLTTAPRNDDKTGGEPGMYFMLENSLITIIHWYRN